MPSGITAPGQRDADGLAGGDVGRAADDLRHVALADRHAGRRDSRSASGCCSRSSTRPTTKLSSAVTPCVWTRSTSVPVMSRRVGELGRRRAAGRRSPSARTGAASSELLQQPKVVLEEHAQVGHAVLEEGDPLDPHAPGEALVLLGVVAGLGARSRRGSGPPSRRRGSRSRPCPCTAGSASRRCRKPCLQLKQRDVELDATAR